MVPATLRLWRSFRRALASLRDFSHPFGVEVSKLSFEFYPLRGMLYCIIFNVIFYAYGV